MGEISRVALLQNIDGSNRTVLRPAQVYCIGRGEQANIRVPDTSVSRVHCMLYWDGRHWVLVDCSTYGTYVNNKAIHKHRLAPGDLLRVSDRSQWEFIEQYVDLAAPEPPPKLEGEETTLGLRLVGGVDSFEEAIIGTSRSTHALRTQVNKSAAGVGAILIRGELGVGKNHVARAIHAASPARHRQLLTVDCRDITAPQLTELLSEKAVGGGHYAPGTIVLQQIESLSAELQSRLLDRLRVLSRMTRDEQQEKMPRIVSISNKSLEELVEAQKFLQDLLARIGVVQILIDPLKDRPEDIPELARHFVQRYGIRFGKPVHEVAPEVLTVLSRHAWPGNVLELRNTIERAVLLADSASINVNSLLRGVTEVAKLAFGVPGLSLEDMEKHHIGETLSATGWKKSRTAEILGIERSTLDRKIKRYGLRRPVKVVGR